MGTVRGRSLSTGAFGVRYAIMHTTQEVLECIFYLCSVRLKFAIGGTAKYSNGVQHTCRLVGIIDMHWMCKAERV